MRYMIKMKKLGEDIQKQRIEEILDNANLQFINVWIAANKEGICNGNGFGFIEAHNVEDIELIMSALASNGISCERY